MQLFLTSYKYITMMNLTKREELVDKINKPKVLNIIFQLTDKCVLSCKYCFAKGSHNEDYKHKYPMETLETSIKQAFEARHETISFEWTGGEPFLMGIDFFKQVIKFQNKYANKKYDNYIQTSGYLFDKELIVFLVDNDIKISTTIDGTKEIHNYNRPTQNNNPSFDKILETYNYIKEKQGYCGFISTVTKKNIGNEAEILNFFRTFGLNSFHSNPYIYIDKNKVKDKQIALDNNDYAKYMINMFNAWFEQGKKKPIPNTLNYILESIYIKKGATHSLCTYGGRCLTNFIAIEPNGDAYICPKFIGFKNMKLGNIHKNKIAFLLSEKSQIMSKFIDNRLSSINKCESENCKYIYLCNSGCPYYSYIGSNGNNISEIDTLCEGKKIVFKYLENVIDIVNYSVTDNNDKYSIDIQTYK